MCYFKDFFFFNLKKKSEVKKFKCIFNQIKLKKTFCENFEKMYIEKLLFNLKKYEKVIMIKKKEKSWLFKKCIKLPISNVFLVKWNSLIIYIKYVYILEKTLDWFFLFIWKKMRKIIMVF